MERDHDKGPESATGIESTRRHGRLRVLITLILFLGLAGLGVAYAQLHREQKETLARLVGTEWDLDQSESRVRQLERDLDDETSRLRGCRDELDEVSSSLSRAMSTIREVESSLGISRNQNSNLAGRVDDLASQIEDLAARYSSCSSSLRETRSDALRWNQEAIRLAGELDECVDIANDRQERINNCIDTANSGIRWITNIPGEGFSIGGFGDPYEQLRQKYNDLVDRFNAAINRCNDLSSLLANSLRELE